MANDPNSKQGRAEMLRSAKQQEQEAKHAAEVWGHTVAEIEEMQRKAGD